MIQIATLADIAEIVSLEAHLDETEDPDVSKEYYQDRQRIETEIVNRRVYVLRDERGIAGVMEFNNDVCDHDAVFLSAMVVKREARMRGIGRSMLDFLVQETRARGKERIITTPTYASQGFYKAYGFDPVRFEYNIE